MTQEYIVYHAFGFPCPFQEEEMKYSDLEFISGGNYFGHTLEHFVVISESITASEDFQSVKLPRNRQPPLDKIEQLTECLREMSLPYDSIGWYIIPVLL